MGKKERNNKKKIGTAEQKITSIHQPEVPFKVI